MTDDLTRRRIHSLAFLLDESIRIPGTNYRIGLDALIGLIPGVGDLIGGALSTFIITQAINLGVPKATVLRMAFNVLVEVIVGTVPFFGDVFDATWKANLRNARLLESSLIDGRPRGRADTGFLIAVVGALILASFLMMTVGIWLLSLLHAALNR